MSASAQFFSSYLIGYLCWVTLSIGCLGVLMIHHLTGGRWGFLIQRFLEAAVGVFPVLTLLILPIFFGLREIYPWVSLRHHSYLNAPFFMIRSVAYLAIWSGLAFGLKRLSAVARLQRLSAWGLVVLVATTTLAFTDWMMSLDPKWTSTIYGLMVLSESALAGLAGAIFLLKTFRGNENLSVAAADDRVRDLGKLLLTFVMFEAYLFYSQYLIIWAGNLREEIPWIVRRTNGGWQWLLLSVVVLQFALPFAFLLPEVSKRNLSFLSGVAAVVVTLHFLHMFVLVGPALYPNHIALHPLDVGSVAAIGALWLFSFSRNLKPATSDNHA